MVFPLIKTEASEQPYIDVKQDWTSFIPLFVLIELFLSLDPSYHSAVYKHVMCSYLTEMLDCSLERLKQ